MNQISAADNHTVQTTVRRWRLLQNERPLAEATPNGLRYGARFGTSRRLPLDGALGQRDILQVVLGWQHTDEAWHLGLILSPSLAAERGSRWCELIHWPDPDSQVFQDLAEATGRDLARTLNVPFNLIQPSPDELAPAPQPLPELPLSFGMWTMAPASADKRRYVIERSSRWVWQKARHIAWNMLWLVVYLAVSLATLFGETALPNTGTLIPPRWLPYLGLLTALLLVGIIVYNVWQMVRLPDRILIDGINGTISAWKGRRVRWQLQAADIHSIYVSEKVKKHEPESATEYGELNVHLGGGVFLFVLAQEEPEDNASIEYHPGKLPRFGDSIRRLENGDVHTSLQAAGLYIAEALGDLPAWYDVRLS